MPYIEIKLSQKMDVKQKEQAQKILTEIVAKGMNKSEQSIMVNFKDGCDLYLGGEKLTHGAYIEIRAFGVSDGAVKKWITLEIYQQMLETFQISNAHVYITFEEKQEWGFLGKYNEK